MTDLLVSPLHPSSPAALGSADPKPRRPQGLIHPTPHLLGSSRARTSSLALGLDLTATGTASHRHGPANEPPAEIDLVPVAHLARTAEHAGFDFVAFDEDFALAPAPRRTAASRLDAARVASRLAAKTSRIGLVATLDTSYLDPGHIATAIGTLHTRTGGRASWQVGTSQARRLGDTPEVWSRLQRDVERVVGGPRREGDDGPSVVVRVQSPFGAAVAGAVADIVRVEALEADHARALRSAVRTAAAAAGRNPDSVRVLVDAVVLLSSDLAAARARLDILSDLASQEPAWRRTLSHLGNPEQFADLLEAWFSDRIADGFVLIPGSAVHDVRSLVTDVLPVLVGRGLLDPRTLAAVGPGVTDGAPPAAGSPDSQTTP
jgi:alkanesulfonate monooxygenase SsuD/methylene tetrahydromethanopterin reductase-like flavin-dependent oxidoreductase (luciferase family)